MLMISWRFLIVSWSKIPGEGATLLVYLKFFSKKMKVFRIFVKFLSKLILIPEVTGSTSIFHVRIHTSTIVSDFNQVLVLFSKKAMCLYTYMLIFIYKRTLNMNKIFLFFIYCPFDVLSSLRTNIPIYVHISQQIANENNLK